MTRKEIIKELKKRGWSVVRSRDAGGSKLWSHQLAPFGISLREAASMEELSSEENLG